MLCRYTLRWDDGDSKQKEQPACNVRRLLLNDDGNAIGLGNDTSHPLHVGSDKFYCGQHIGASLAGSDGRCGPWAGPQCQSCLRFQLAVAVAMSKLGEGNKVDVKTLGVAFFDGPWVVREDEIVLVHEGKWSLHDTEYTLDETSPVSFKWPDGAVQTLASYNSASNIATWSVEGTPDYTTPIPWTKITVLTDELESSVADVDTADESGIVQLEISEAHISAAIKEVITEELGKHSVSEGTKAHNKFKEKHKDKAVSKWNDDESTAGNCNLQFQPEQVAVTAAACNLHLDDEASVVMVAVLEYLTAEILELSGGESQAAGDPAITTMHVASAVNSDMGELEVMFGELCDLQELEDSEDQSEVAITIERVAKRIKGLVESVQPPKASQSSAALDAAAAEATQPSEAPVKAVPLNDAPTTATLSIDLVLDPVDDVDEVDPELAAALAMSLADEGDQEYLNTNAVAEAEVVPIKDVGDGVAAAGAAVLDVLNSTDVTADAAAEAKVVPLEDTGDVKHDDSLTAMSASFDALVESGKPENAEGKDDAQEVVAYTPSKSDDSVPTNSGDTTATECHSVVSESTANEAPTKEVSGMPPPPSAGSSSTSTPAPLFAPTTKIPVEKIKATKVKDSSKSSKSAGSPFKGPKGEYINIVVKAPDGSSLKSEVHFKIRTTTALKKLMHAYAKHEGKLGLTRHYKFSYNGITIQSEDTPASHGITDDACITVTLLGDGVARAYGRDVAHQDILYCGRMLGTTLIPGSDGYCGPANGPPCPDCRKATKPSKNAAGFVVSWGLGFTFKNVLYCGRNLGTDAIPGSDGHCGPNDGPQCSDCRKLQEEGERYDPGAIGFSKGDQVVVHGLNHSSSNGANGHIFGPMSAAEDDTEEDPTYVVKINEGALEGKLVAVKFSNLKSKQSTSNGSLGDSTSAVLGAFASGYHVEYIRYLTFHTAVKQGYALTTVTDELLAGARALAAAGFFFKPGTKLAPATGQIVHFEAGVVVPAMRNPSFVRLVADPLKELAILAPQCDSVLGEPTANVPLATTLAAMQSVSHGPSSRKYESLGSRVDILTVLETPHAELLATGTCDGHVSLWTTTPPSNGTPVALPRKLIDVPPLKMQLSKMTQSDEKKEEKEKEDPEEAAKKQKALAEALAAKQALKVAETAARAERFKAQCEQLASMGLYDVDRNLFLLEKYNGDLTKTMDALFSNDAFASFDGGESLGLFGGASNGDGGASPAQTTLAAEADDAGADQDEEAKVCTDACRQLLATADETLLAVELIPSRKMTKSEPEEEVFLDWAGGWCAPGITVKIISESHPYAGAPATVIGCTPDKWYTVSKDGVNVYTRSDVTSAHATNTLGLIEIVLAKASRVQHFGERDGFIAISSDEKQWVQIKDGDGVELLKQSAPNTCTIRIEAFGEELEAKASELEVWRPDNTGERAILLDATAPGLDSTMKGKLCEVVTKSTAESPIWTIKFEDSNEVKVPASKNRIAVVKGDGIPIAETAVLSRRKETPRDMTGMGVVTVCAVAPETAGGDDVAGVRAGGQILIALWSMEDDNKRVDLRHIANFSACMPRDFTTVHTTYEPGDDSIIFGFGRADSSTLVSCKVDRSAARLVFAEPEPNNTPHPMHSLGAVEGEGVVPGELVAIESPGRGVVLTLSRCGILAIHTCKQQILREVRTQQLPNAPFTHFAISNNAAPPNTQDGDDSLSGAGPTMAALPVTVVAGRADGTACVVSQLVREPPLKLVDAAPMCIDLSAQTGVEQLLKGLQSQRLPVRALGPPGRMWANMGAPKTIHWLAQTHCHAEDYSSSGSGNDSDPGIDMDDTDMLSALRPQRQMTDMMSARESAQAQSLSWDLDLDKPCQLSRLTMDLDLKPACDMHDTHACKIGPAPLGGLLCKVGAGDAGLQRFECTVELWVRPSAKFAGSASNVDNTPAPAVVFSAYSDDVETSSNNLNFELVVHSTGTLQLVVLPYGEEATRCVTPLVETRALRLQQHTWTHVAAAVTGTCCMLYVNGDFLSSVHYRLPTTVPPLLLLIGTRPTTGEADRFAASIRHVRMWYGDRTQPEIRADMRASLSDYVTASSSKLVGCWPLCCPQTKGEPANSTAALTEARGGSAATAWPPTYTVEWHYSSVPAVDFAPKIQLQVETPGKGVVASCALGASSAELDLSGCVTKHIKVSLFRLDSGSNSIDCGQETFEYDIEGAVLVLEGQPYTPTHQGSTAVLPTTLTTAAVSLDSSTVRQLYKTLRGESSSRVKLLSLQALCKHATPSNAANHIEVVDSFPAKALLANVVQHCILCCISSEVAERAVVLLEHVTQCDDALSGGNTRERTQSLRAMLIDVCRDKIAATAKDADEADNKGSSSSCMLQTHGVQHLCALLLNGRGVSKRVTVDTMLDTVRRLFADSRAAVSLETRLLRQWFNIYSPIMDESNWPTSRSAATPLAKRVTAAKGGHTQSLRVQPRGLHEVTLTTSFKGNAAGRSTVFYVKFDGAFELSRCELDIAKLVEGKYGIRVEISRLLDTDQVKGDAAVAALGGETDMDDLTAPTANSSVNFAIQHCEASWDGCPDANKLTFSTGQKYTVHKVQKTSSGWFFTTTSAPGLWAPHSATSQGQGEVSPAATTGPAGGWNSYGAPSYGAQAQTTVDGADGMPITNGDEVILLADALVVKALQQSPGASGWSSALKHYCGKTGKVTNLSGSSHSVTSLSVIFDHDGATWAINSRALTLVGGVAGAGSGSIPGTEDCWEVLMTAVASPESEPFQTSPIVKLSPGTTCCTSRLKVAVEYFMWCSPKELEADAHASTKLNADPKARIGLAIYGEELLVNPSHAQADTMPVLIDTHTEALAGIERERAILWALRRDVKRIMGELDYTVLQGVATKLQSSSCVTSVADTDVQFKALVENSAVYPGATADHVKSLGQKLELMTQTSLKLQSHLRHLEQAISELSSIGITVVDWECVGLAKGSRLQRPGTWEHKHGQSLFVAEQILVSLHETGCYLDSPLMDMEFCQALFMTHAVHSPTRVAVANAVCEILQKVGAVSGEAGETSYIAELPTRILKATVGSSDTTLHCNASAVFRMVVELATSGIAANFSMAPIVRTLRAFNDARNFPVDAVRWSLLLISRILDSQNSLQHSKMQGSQSSKLSVNRQPQNEASPGLLDAAVHPGTRCHLTGMNPIRGARFFCVTRPNYDLCESAWKDPTNKKLLEGLYFLKMRHPLPLPPQADAVPCLAGVLLPQLAARYAADKIKKKKPDATAAAKDSTFHKGVHCCAPGCSRGKLDIKGTRFVSVLDEDFNLCETCEWNIVSSIQAAQMPLLALREPLPDTDGKRSDQLRCDYATLAALAQPSGMRAEDKGRRTFAFPAATSTVAAMSDDNSNIPVASSSSAETDVDPVLQEPQVPFASLRQASRDPSNEDVVAEPGLMGTLFQLLSSPVVLHPSNTFLFTLGADVLCQFASQVPPETVREIIEHEQFFSFLRAASAAKDPFQKSAAKRLIQSVVDLSARGDDPVNRTEVAATLTQSVFDVLLGDAGGGLPAEYVPAVAFLLDVVLAVKVPNMHSTRSLTGPQAMLEPGAQAKRDLQVQLWLGSGMYIVKMPALASMADAKRHVAMRTGLDPGIQRLSVGGVMVPDHAQLSEQPRQHNAVRLHVGIDNSILPDKIAQEVAAFVESNGGTIEPASLQVYYRVCKDQSCVTSMAHTAVDSQVKTTYTKFRMFKDEVLLLTDADIVKLPNDSPGAGNSGSGWVGIPTTSMRDHVAATGCDIGTSFGASAAVSGLESFFADPLADPFANMPGLEEANLPLTCQHCGLVSSSVSKLGSHILTAHPEVLGGSGFGAPNAFGAAGGFGHPGVLMGPNASAPPFIFSAPHTPTPEYFSDGLHDYMAEQMTAPNSIGMGFHLVQSTSGFGQPGVPPSVSTAAPSSAADSNKHNYFLPMSDSEGSLILEKVPEYLAAFYRSNPQDHEYLCHSHTTGDKLAFDAEASLQCGFAPGSIDKSGILSFPNGPVPAISTVTVSAMDPKTRSISWDFTATNNSAWSVGVKPKWRLFPLTKDILYGKSAGGYKDSFIGMNCFIDSGGGSKTHMQAHGVRIVACVDVVSKTFSVTSKESGEIFYSEDITPLVDRQVHLVMYGCNGTRVEMHGWSTMEVNHAKLKAAADAIQSDTANKAVAASSANSAAKQPIWGEDEVLLFEQHSKLMVQTTEGDAWKSRAGGAQVIKMMWSPTTKVGRLVVLKKDSGQLCCNIPIIEGALGPASDAGGETIANFMGRDWSDHEEIETHSGVPPFKQYRLMLKTVENVAQFKKHFLECTQGTVVCAAADTASDPKAVVAKTEDVADVAGPIASPFEGVYCSCKEAMQLSSDTTGAYAGGWVCDRCDAHKTGERFWCSGCSTDYCVSCAKPTASANAQGKGGGLSDQEAAALHKLMEMEDSAYTAEDRQELKLLMTNWDGESNLRALATYDKGRPIRVVVRVTGRVVTFDVTPDTTAAALMPKIYELAGVPLAGQTLFASTVTGANLVRLAKADTVAGIRHALSTCIVHIVCVMSPDSLTEVRKVQHSTPGTGGALISTTTGVRFATTMAGLFERYQVDMACWSACWQVMRNVCDLSELIQQDAFPDQLEQILASTLTASDTIARATCDDVVACAQVLYDSVRTNAALRATVHRSVLAAVTATLSLQQGDSEAAEISRSLLKLIRGQMLSAADTGAVDVAHVCAMIDLVIDVLSRSNMPSKDVRVLELVLMVETVLRHEDSGSALAATILAHVARRQPGRGSAARVLLEWLADLPAPPDTRAMSWEDAHSEKTTSRISTALVDVFGLVVRATATTPEQSENKTLPPGSSAQRSAKATQSLINTLVIVLLRGTTTGSVAVANSAAYSADCPRSTILDAAKTFIDSSSAAAEQVAKALAQHRLNPPRIEHASENSSTAAGLAKVASNWVLPQPHPQHWWFSEHKSNHLITDVTSQCFVASIEGVSLVGETALKLMQLLSCSTAAVGATVSTPVNITVGAHGTWNMTLEFEEDLVILQVDLGFACSATPLGAGKKDKFAIPDLVSLETGARTSRLTPVLRQHVPVEKTPSAQRVKLDLAPGPAIRVLSLTFRAPSESVIQLTDLSCFASLCGMAPMTHSRLTTTPPQSLPLRTLALACSANISVTAALAPLPETVRLVQDLLAHISANVEQDSARLVCLALLQERPELRAGALDTLLGNEAGSITRSLGSARFYGAICAVLPECFLPLWSFIAKHLERITPIYGSELPYVSAGTPECLSMVADAIISLHRSNTLPPRFAAQDVIASLVTLACWSSDKHPALYSPTRQLLCSVCDVSSDARSVLFDALLAQCAECSTPPGQPQLPVARKGSLMEGTGAAPNREATWSLVGQLCSARPSYCASLRPALEEIVSHAEGAVQHDIRALASESVSTFATALGALIGVCHTAWGKERVGKQLLGAAVRLLAELRTDDDADLLKGTGENVSNFVTLQDNGLHLMYACWNRHPKNRKIVIQEVARALLLVTKLNSFLRQLLIDCRQMGDVVHVLLDIPSADQEGASGSAASKNEASIAGSEQAGNTATMVGVCVNAEFIENHEYSSWGGTKSHSVAGQIMLVGNPSAAELKLVVYLRNSSKVHYSHEIPKDFEFQHADDKSFTWSVLAKGSPRAKTYKLKFPNAQAKSQFHSAFKVYHERVVAEVQKIKAENADPIKSLPTYSPKLLYSTAGNTVCVDSSARLLEVLAGHLGRRGKWSVHADGDVREPVTNMLNTVSELLAASGGSDCLRLSLLYDNIGDCKDTAGAADGTNHPLPVDAASVSDTARDYELAKKVAIGSWAGEWMSVPNRGLSFVYDIHIVVNTVALVGGNGAAAVAGSCTFTLAASPAIVEGSTGAADHPALGHCLTFKLEGMFNAHTRELMLHCIPATAAEAVNATATNLHLKRVGLNLCFNVSGDGEVIGGYTSPLRIEPGAIFPTERCFLATRAKHDGVTAPSQLFAPPQTNSVLLELANRGDLSQLMSLVKTRLSEESRTLEVELEAASAADRPALKKKVTTRRQLFAWLSAMEGSLDLPGFVQRFLADQRCATLLLHALGADVVSVELSEIPAFRDMLEDPIGNQVIHLTQLLKEARSESPAAANSLADSAAKPVTADELWPKCLEKGTLDIILLHLGKLHDQTPADYAWTDQYEDPAIVRERIEREQREEDRRKKDARNKSQAAPKEEGAVDWGVAGFVGDDDDGGGATMLGAAKGKPGTASATDTREAEAKKRKEQTTTATLCCLASFLNVPDRIRNLVDEAKVRQVLQASSLFKVLRMLLMDAGTDDVTACPAKFMAVIDLVEAIMLRENLAPLLHGTGSAATSTSELLKKLLFRVDAVLKVKDGDAAPDEQAREALGAIVERAKRVVASLEAWQKTFAAIIGGDAPSSTQDLTYEDLYMQLMSTHAFAYRDIVNDKSHVFKYKGDLGGNRESSPARQKVTN